MGGDVGDVFRVTFQRVGDTRTISWEFVEHGSPNIEELTKNFKYCLRSRPLADTDMTKMDGEGLKELYTKLKAGNWDFCPTVELQPCEDNVLMAELQMTFFSKHLFHIEVNGNCLSIVHPNTAEASFLDEGHCLEGPDCHGISLFWCIGGN